MGELFDKKPYCKKELEFRGRENDNYIQATTVAGVYSLDKPNSSRGSYFVDFFSFRYQSTQPVAAGVSLQIAKEKANQHWQDLHLGGLVEISPCL